MATLYCVCVLTFFQCPLALGILFLLQTCIRAPKITLYIVSQIICMPNLFLFIKKIIHDAPHTVVACKVVEIDCNVWNLYLKLSCKIHIVHLIIFQIVQLTWSCFVHHIFHIVQLISLHFPYICNFEITTLICLTPWVNYLADQMLKLIYGPLMSELWIMLLCIFMF